MSNQLEKEVIYVAELDADVDDVVAAEYLHNKGVLRCVVLDPLPETEQGKERMKMLEKLGITICTEIPEHAKYVFIGGALTEVARYIEDKSIEVLVMNGGFVGTNIVSPKHQLKKFSGKETVRTFNFNCDVQATDKVLRSTEQQIGKIILIGKNVCHSERNTETDLWNDTKSKKLFAKYHVRAGKCQHDMLACHEGLAHLSLGGVKIPYCTYLTVHPYNEGLNKTMTKWGSKKESTEYREVVAAITLL